MRASMRSGSSTARTGKPRDALDARNLAFSLSNSWKQYVGQIDALNNPVIMARKRDAERQLRDSINAQARVASAVWRT